MKIANTYGNVTEAYLDKGLLEAHGIKGFVQSYALSEIFPAPGAGLGSIQLLVADSDLDEARRILSEK